MIARLAHAAGYILDEFILNGYTAREEQRRKWNEAVANAARRLDQALEEDRAA